MVRGWEGMGGRGGGPQMGRDRKGWGREGGGRWEEMGREGEGRWSADGRGGEGMGRKGGGGWEGFARDSRGSTDDQSELRPDRRPRKGSWFPARRVSRNPWLIAGGFHGWAGKGEPVGGGKGASCTRVEPWSR